MDSSKANLASSTWLASKWSNFLGEQGETALDTVYLGFSKAFNTVSPNILSGKLGKFGLNEWTVR